MNRIQVYTGEGKGKTTAALGLLLRFLGSGGKAVLIQFDKGAGSDDFYGERRLFPLLTGLTHHATGLVRFVPARGTFRFQNIPGDFAEAQRGMDLAHEALASGAGMVVLDEILSLLLTGLIGEDAIDALLDHYEKLGRPCELILTGHKIFPALELRADLITRMEKLKHYFDQGEPARKGIEF
ncbi:MAG TPA: cob(I)yrinic acid a,c-diamide adenosyltransferase [bacterium]|jgi:cob(I)alamin adenosyltransferase|nr:cob(I)yrinic acid a,c-diamide adenosyltransferase [bacterium]